MQAVFMSFSEIYLLVKDASSGEASAKDARRWGSQIDYQCLLTTDAATRLLFAVAEEWRLRPAQQRTTLAEALLLLADVLSEGHQVAVEAMHSRGAAVDCSRIALLAQTMKHVADAVAFGIPPINDW